MTVEYKDSGGQTSGMCLELWLNYEKSYIMSRLFLDTTMRNRFTDNIMRTGHNDRS